MTTDTIEKLITNSIRAAFVKYPEGDWRPASGLGMDFAGA
jgi:hypothetical protein